MINAVVTNEYPVVYDPPKPQKIIPTEYDLIRFDKFGMGSIIGQITNKGASAYAMLPLIEQRHGKDSEEYKLLLSRLRQTCKAQSCQIDKTKLGRQVKEIPNSWTEKDFYGTEDEMLEKNNINNHCLLNRRPYFFKYLYKDSRQEFNQYNEEQDYISSLNFGIKLKDLLAMEYADLTKEEQDFVNRYYERCPLIISDSAMNLLCRYIEQLNFNLKKKIKNPVAHFDYHCLRNNSVQYTEDQKRVILTKLKNTTRLLSSEKRLNIGSGTTKTEIIKNAFFEVESNVDVIVNVLIDNCYADNKGKKDLIWSVFGKEIFDNLMKNNHDPIYFPFKDEEGDIEYLGQRFKIKEVKNIE